MIANCKSCFYYHGTMWQGSCYFNPPLATGMRCGVPQSVRPEVAPDNHCGQWKLNEELECPHCKDLP